MAEIEMQINQVQTRLNGLADALGIVIDRVSEVEEYIHGESSSDETENSRTDVSDESVISWKLEDFRAGKVKTSTFKSELETMLAQLQNKVPQPMESDDSRSGAEDTSSNLRSLLKQRETSGIEKVIDGTFNLDAFTDIASCQTEIEALSRKCNLATLESTIHIQSEDHGQQLEKFLNDVSAASDEHKPVTSFGKYGKTSAKLNPKFSSKLLPTYDISNVLQSTEILPDRVNNNSLGHQVPSVLAWHNRPDTQIPSSNAMASSNLRRTKTHGRGKGHVDVLDIESFKTDSDDDLQT
ncbi:hypothetical protein SK128_009648 [Halocaridina rubra]|uniref:Uncharacterized protein n=1 Tax=Halocaridina rubra TaxID=373956 RepID=A0AAN8XHQ4_HALRR